MNILAFFVDLPLRQRVTAALIFIVLIAMLSSGYLSFKEYQSSLIAESVEHLNDARNNRIVSIREDIQRLIIDLELFSSVSDVTEELSYHEKTNAHSLKFEEGISGFLNFLQRTTNAYDLFIINKKGEVIHTVLKEDDYNTNLISGPYRDSELGVIFRKSMRLLQPQISTVKYYDPSGEPALFIATPVIHNGQLLGAVAAQLNWEQIINILRSISGLGETGEVVAGLLRDDKAYLSPLRNMPSSKFDLNIEIGQEKAGPMQQALKGNMGSDFDIDYRNIEVISSWGYIPEMEMGIVVKQDVHELLAPVRKMQFKASIFIVIVLLIVSFIAVLLASTITEPLKYLAETVEKYGKGNSKLRSTIHSRDEVGLLAKAFNDMADNLEAFSISINKKNKQLVDAAMQLENKVEERTATLAAANEEIKSFAYIVSHDLRSPLVNMKGFTGELQFTLKEINEKIAPMESKLDKAEKDELHRLIEEDVPESVRFINIAVSKMDVMLTAILKLSRLGRREWQIETVDLHQMCQTILESLEFQIRETKTEVELGDLPIINNDRLVMKQILGNLIGNALKYLDKNRPGRLHIWCEQINRGILINVQDNGRGISDGEKDKVFQIFRRGRHEDVQGEGMGLAYVRTLARAQNGSIHYTSEEGAGSTFIVFLPTGELNDTSQNN